MTPDMGEIDLHDSVRSADPARYFANQFIPAAHRSDAFALHAFDIEIRKITRTVREPMAGEIRLQWWREVFHGERDAEAAASPLARVVLDFAQRHSISSDIWDTYLDGRIFDLYDDAVEDRAAFEAYAGQTDGTILQLGCLILDRQQSPSASQVSGNMACALSLWNRVLQPIIRASHPVDPHLLTKVARYISPELGEAAGLMANPFLEQKTPDLQRFVKDICAEAERYLVQARSAAHVMPQSLRPAFLPTTPIALQISQIHRQSQPNLPLREPGTLRLIWQIWRGAKRWPCF